MTISTKKRLLLQKDFPINRVEIFSDDVHFSGGGVSSHGTYSSLHAVTGESHSITTKSRYKGRHRRRRRKQRRVFLDLGGPVSITHRYKFPEEIRVETHTRPPGTGGTRQTYEGNLCVTTTPLTGTSFALVPSQIGDSVLTALGTKAWALVKPTSNRGGLAQALGELRDLPSNPVKFLKEAQANLRNIPHGNKGLILKNLTKGSAGQHLNIQFGILPLVKDIKDLIDNVRNLEKNLAQLERDNGRPVRRWKHFAGSESTTTSITNLSSLQTGAALTPSLATGFFPSGGQKIVEVTESWDFRFNARFRYHIDWAKAHEGRLKELLQLSRILLGLDLSISTLYELMPWSWLFDWFANLGDVISNLANDQTDHLVADYAYMNGKYTKLTQTTIVAELKNSTSPDGPYKFQSFDKTVAFHRIKATPYGFGLTMQQLNAKQLGILAALGLTRLL